MTPTLQVDYILHDCLFAIGQAIGRSRRVDGDAIEWIRSRYHDTFVHVMTHQGNSWSADRHRVTAVARYLGQRAVFHAGGRPVIDLDSMMKAALDVERGCQMNATREAALPPCAGGVGPAGVRTRPTRRSFHRRAAVAVRATHDR